MLHWLKVAWLLLLTLIAMRLLSWGPMWVCGKVTKSTNWKPALLFNGIAWSLFIAFLRWQMMPGEPFDTAAAIFGAVVYLVFFIVDLLWLPWKDDRSE